MNGLYQNWDSTNVFIKIRFCLKLINLDYLTNTASFLLAFWHSENTWSSKLSPIGIHLLKINNRNTRTRCEICSKLTIKTPERRHWRRSGVFIVNFEHISDPVLVFLLLTLSMYMPIGSFNSIFWQGIIMVTDNRFSGTN